LSAARRLSLSRTISKTSLGTIGTTALAAATAVAVATGCAPVAKNTTDVGLLASQQMGKPYVWGAIGPNAFDCSGLVQFVFGRAGRVEPRTAQAQYNASTPLTPQQVVRGDLVFFGAPGAVYHVGIYVGAGQMIDAAHAGTNVRQEKVWPGAAFGRLNQ
jgi:cell wall-associated NlpC family hydrolase